MQQELIAQLQSRISELYSIHNLDISLSTPPKKEDGDAAFGVFILAKELKKSPVDISRELAESFHAQLPSFISRVQNIGPYLNFYFASDMYESALGELLGKESLLSQANTETVVVDYIGANVGKPLHIGHMCTPCQGQALINMFKKRGYKVISDSHIGDWGIIFGKLLVAFEKYGDEDKLAENAVEHLFELYVQISSDAEKDSNLEDQFRAAFKELSGGEIEAIQRWASFTKSSIDSMNESLSRLFVHPDYNIGESFYEGLGLPKMEDYPDLGFSMHEIVEELIEKNIAVRNDDNSVGVTFPDETKMPSCILQKRDGTHGYLASDLACIRYRMDSFAPSKIVYCVDVRQQLHFRQAFYIAKAAGWLKADTEITHAHNGFISLKDGAMSTRKGTIIPLNALLDEAQQRAKDILMQKRDDISLSEIDELSKIVGIAAIKYGYLKKSRETDIVFDWDEYMSFEGNSGPYIQYAYVRAKKILSEASSVDMSGKIILQSDDQKQLAKTILFYDETVDAMEKTLHPHILCQYIYELSRAFTSFYSNTQVLSEHDNDQKNSHFLILSLYTRTIEDACEIIGIPLPEKM